MKTFYFLVFFHGKSLARISTLLIDAQALIEKMHSKRLVDMKDEKRLTPRSLFRLITAHLLHNEIVFYRDAKSMTFNTVATFIILFLPRFIRTWIYEWFVWCFVWSASIIARVWILLTQFQKTRVPRAGERRNIDKNLYMHRHRRSTYI